MDERMDYKLGRRRLETKNGEKVESIWENISIDEYIVDKPIVLVLGGNSTTGTAMANGYAKQVSNYLGDFANDVDVLSIYYENKTEKNDEIVNAFLMVEKFFSKLIAYDKDGKPDFETTRKNMRKINMFAHCYGDVFAERISKYLLTKLVKVGFTEEQAKQIISQMFLVSYGIVTEQPYINTVSAISPYDDVFIEGSQAYWKKLLENLDQMDTNSMSEEDKKLLKVIKQFKNDGLRNAAYRYLQQFYEDNQRCFAYMVESSYTPSKNILLAVSPLFKNSLKSGVKDDEHQIHQLRRDAHYKIDSDASEAGDNLSLICACALKMAVENSRQNENSDKLIPLDMNEILGTIRDLSYELNHQVTKDNIEFEF